MINLEEGKAELKFMRSSSELRINVFAISHGDLCTLRLMAHLHGTGSGTGNGTGNIGYATLCRTVHTTPGLGTGPDPLSPIMQV